MKRIKVNINGKTISVSVRSIINEFDAEYLYQRANPEWDGMVFQYVIDYFVSLGFRWSGQTKDLSDSFFYN